MKKKGEGEKRKEHGKLFGLSINPTRKREKKSLNVMMQPNEMKGKQIKGEKEEEKYLVEESRA